MLKNIFLIIIKQRIDQENVFTNYMNVLAEIKNMSIFIKLHRLYNTKKNIP